MVLSKLWEEELDFEEFPNMFEWIMSSHVFRLSLQLIFILILI
jgi:flagellar biogenesis protein FliO